MNILSLQKISKSFGSYLANDEISFTVETGKIFGILGPNGAGKTTLIRIITHIFAADSGHLYFNDEPLHVKHQSFIGYMPEERGLYKKMEVFEHLLYLARLKNLSKSEAKKKINYWFEKLDIATWQNKKIEELSKGMQQKVQFVATVLHDPQLLILDEPFSGLDPLNSQIIQQEIYELQKQGKTILFSTHRMEQVEEICEEIVLINKGKNILQGSVADIKQQFKQHIFFLEYYGNPEPTIFKNFQIIEQKNNSIQFKLNENENSNDLLSYCIENHIAIKSFKEILPSLNEIFIAQVSTPSTN